MIRPFWWIIKEAFFYAIFMDLIVFIQEFMQFFLSKVKYPLQSFTNEEKVKKSAEYTVRDFIIYSVGQL